MSNAPYAGGCLCGAVRLESLAAPYRVGICHCLDCRKHHGAVFGTYAVFPAEEVAVTGKTSEYRGRPFCPTCGRSEEHTSELQSLMRTSYAVFRLNKKMERQILFPIEHTTTITKTPDVPP